MGNDCSSALGTVAPSCCCFFFFSAACSDPQALPCFSFQFSTTVFFFHSPCPCFTCSAKLLSYVVEASLLFEQLILTARFESTKNWYFTFFKKRKGKNYMPTTKAEQQQAYIRKHNLAALIDVLMQQLLAEKPQRQPLEWLADRVAVERSLRASGRSLAPCLGE